VKNTEAPETLQALQQQQCVKSKVYRTPSSWLHVINCLETYSQGLIKVRKLEYALRVNKTFFYTVNPFSVMLHKTSIVTVLSFSHFR